jgi:glycosyltransferase involved in cell wall biosynthesis
MKILHISYAYPPVTGGVSAVIQYVSEYLVKFGHQVTVVTQTEPGRAFSQLNGVHIEQFDIHGSEYRGLQAASGEVERYRGYMLQAQADLLMIYTGLSWPFDLLLPILDDLPYATVFNPVGLQYSLNLIPYQQRMGEAMSRFDHIMYHSPDGPDTRFGRRYGVTNYSVVHNGAAFEEFARPSDGFKQAYNIKTRNMLLDVAGYARTHKRQEYVLEAFLKARPKDTTMVFIGVAPNPQQRRYLRLLRLLGLAVQARTGLGSVRLLEGVSRQETVAAFFEADMFVHGAAWECAPVVIYEAMAAGLPWLCTDVGNISELEGGVLCTFPDQMAEAIRTLLPDEAARHRLGAEGRAAWGKKYTWEAVSREYERIYQQVIRQAQSQRLG